MWIKNRDTVIDWEEILYGAELPRGIQPSDIDGIIEINNHFLVMEVKHPGEGTKDGQRLLLERLAKRRGFTVIRIVRGDDGVEEIYNYKTKIAKPTTPLEFIALVEKWARQADESRT